MKKILIAFGAILLSTNLVSAQITSNLKYGQKNDSVSELQEFLASKGFLSSSPTRFFGLMTLKAVKEYQLSLGLPSTGYVGAMTREAINKDISLEVESSTVAEVSETGTTTPIVNTPVYVAPATTPTPVQTVMQNNVQAYSPVVIDKRDISIVSNPTNGITTNDIIGFTITVKDKSGNKTNVNDLYVTVGGVKSEAKKLTDTYQNQYQYTYQYKPSAPGDLVFNFDIPELGIKKDVTVSVSQYVPIPPTVSFKTGWISNFNINTASRLNIGYIDVDKKNQNIVVKDFEYEIISNDFTKDDIYLKVCDNFTNSGKSDILTSCGLGFPIEFFPMNKLTKTGKFQVKITKLNLIHDYMGGLNDNNISIDTTGFVSQEVSVVK